ncbi:MAG: hypothetical protein Q8N23_23055 [Archangium sp.]|nr:hypothetical protein [Archangium sp.]MDP3155569.1 hypothetical protein [Archangium sp.]
MSTDTLDNDMAALAKTGDLGAAALREAHVSARERRRVVDAVTHRGHESGAA